MLIYYHGTDEKSINSIIKNGANVKLGGGELGQGFYVGSSLWRAFSWAWQKSNPKNLRCGVIEYSLNEYYFLSLDILCKNRVATQTLYSTLDASNQTNNFNSGHDAIWTPIVGKNVKDAYQIKFESKKGELYINQQNKTVLWQ